MRHKNKKKTKIIIIIIIGFRKECCLSPILFNVYSEKITQETLEGFGDFKYEQMYFSM
jgi:hypothetical protein